MFLLKFGWALNKGHIDETIQQNPHLAAEVGGAISTFERTIRVDIGSRLTTMFWLPAVDPDADRRAVDSLDVEPLRSDREGLETLTSC
jgi:hypothetical protein